jgi:hypothetical protein
MPGEAVGKITDPHIAEARVRTETPWKMALATIPRNPDRRHRVALRFLRALSAIPEKQRPFA